MYTKSKRRLEWFCSTAAVPDVNGGPMDDHNQSALELLQELDARHARVLDDLESLNAQVESVINSYTQARRSDQNAGE
jgi:hypothetical protein